MAALQDGETCSRHPLPSLLYAAQLSCVSGRATSSRTAAPSDRGEHDFRRWAFQGFLFCWAHDAPLKSSR